MPGSHRQLLHSYPPRHLPHPHHQKKWMRNRLFFFFFIIKFGLQIRAAADAYIYNQTPLMSGEIEYSSSYLLMNKWWCCVTGAVGLDGGARHSFRLQSAATCHSVSAHTRKSFHFSAGNQRVTRTALRRFGTVVRGGCWGCWWWRESLLLLLPSPGIVLLWITSQPPDALSVPLGRDFGLLVF